MTIDQIELVIESQAILGESPCWDEKKQLLYWVDILQKQLHIYQPQTNRDRIIQLDELVSCVVLRESRLFDDVSHRFPYEKRFCF